MKVTILGTSAGQPTEKRNVSAVAVSLEREWVLFDCGEDTQRRMLAAGLKPSKLERIFITHLHGDHVIGLLALIGTLSLHHRDRPLYIYGPPGISDLLHTAKRVQLFYPAYDLVIEEITAAGEICRGDGYTVNCAPLDHRVTDYGYRLSEQDRPGKFDVDAATRLGVPPGPLYQKLQNGEYVTLADGRTVHPREVLGKPRPGSSIAYCTDTRPCQNAIELAHKVDLLVHESTYTKEESEKASERGHSTAEQAAHIAKKAAVRRLVLTHFSSRYDELTPFLAEAKEVFPFTELASDLSEFVA
ncbi:MAG TPA: ribonuclease Z [Blastocatellia bacterium]|nr:ribonuclease Z [Blastocatellia bacterium]